MKKGLACPHCGGLVAKYRNPLLTVDIIIELEETCLDVELLGQLGAYSAPDRDPRHHTITVVFLARAGGEPKARDDAREVGVFTEKDLPSPLAFDHAQILTDYFVHKKRRQ